MGENPCPPPYKARVTGSNPVPPTSFESGGCGGFRDPFPFRLIYVKDRIVPFAENDPEEKIPLEVSR